MKPALKSGSQLVVVVAPELPPTVSSKVMDREVKQSSAACADRADISSKCRILLNDAQREIDRLRRGLSEGPWEVAQDLLCGGESWSDPPSSPQSRRIYAVDPIGEPPPPVVESPPSAPSAHVLTRPHVTNLGTLLDVLI